METIIAVRTANSTTKHMEERGIPSCDYEERRLKKDPGDGAWQAMDWIHLVDGPKFLRLRFAWFRISQHCRRGSIVDRLLLPGN